MVSCFNKSKHARLFFFAGGLLAAALTVCYVDEHIAVRIIYAVMALSLFVLLGLFTALKIAGGENAKWINLLYNDLNTQAFITEYTKIIDVLKPNSAEYMMCINHLSNAYAAEGNYEKAIALLEGAGPEKLNYHRLGIMALTYNNLCSHYLFGGETNKARAMLDNLEKLAEETKKRMPLVSKNLENNVRLHLEHMRLLRKEPVDIHYIEEELTLATNEIHRANMKKLLDKANSMQH